MTNDSTPAPLVDMGAETDCPYPNGSHLRLFWQDGFEGRVGRRYGGDFDADAMRAIVEGTRAGAIRAATAPAAAPIEAEPACPKCHIHPDSAMARMTACIRKDCPQTATEVPQEAATMPCGALRDDNMPETCCAAGGLVRCSLAPVDARPFEFEGNRRAVAAVREAVGHIQALTVSAKREAQHLFDLAPDAEDMAHLSMAIDRLATFATALATPAKLEIEQHPGSATGEDLAIYQGIANNYRAPQARSSVPLSDAQLDSIYNKHYPYAVFVLGERHGIAAIRECLRDVERAAHGILAADSMETK